MDLNQKPYTAELNVYNGGDILLVVKRFDKFSAAVEACKKIRKSAADNFICSRVYKNKFADILHEMTAQGEEFFYAYRNRDDYDEIVLAAGGANAENLLQVFNVYKMTFVQWGKIVEAFFSTFVKAYEACQEFIAEGGTDCAIGVDDEVLYEFFKDEEYFSVSIDSTDLDDIIEISDGKNLTIW